MCRCSSSASVSAGASRPSASSAAKAARHSAQYCCSRAAWARGPRHPIGAQQAGHVRAVPLHISRKKDMPPLLLGIFRPAARRRSGMRTLHDGTAAGLTGTQVPSPPQQELLAVCRSRHGKSKRRVRPASRMRPPRMGPARRRPSMTNCAWCGRTAAARDAFCTGCGQPLYEAPPAPCEACGAALPPDAAYCGRCGALRHRQDSARWQPPREELPRTPPPSWRIAGLGLGVATASRLALWLWPVANLLDHSFSISQAAAWCTVSPSRPGLAAVARMACQASNTGQLLVQVGVGLGGRAGPGRDVFGQRTRSQAGRR